MADAVAKLKDHRFAGSHTDLSKFPDGLMPVAVNVDLVEGGESTKMKLAVWSMVMCFVLRRPTIRGGLHGEVPNYAGVAGS